MNTPSSVFASRVTTRSYVITGGLAEDPVVWGPTILATVLAFGVGLTVIAWLLRYLDRGSFTPFVVHRIVLGGLILVLVATGVLAPT